MVKASKQIIINIDPDLKKDFKAQCAKDGKDMTGGEAWCSIKIEFG